MTIDESKRTNDIFFTVIKADGDHTQPTCEMTPALLRSSLSQSQTSSRKLTRPSFLSVNGRRAQNMSRRVHCVWPGGWHTPTRGTLRDLNWNCTKCFHLTGVALTRFEDVLVLSRNCEGLCNVLNRFTLTYFTIFLDFFSVGLPWV